MGWTVRESNPLGGEISVPFQTDPGAYTASCKMGTGSFPGIKRPGRGADLPSSSNAEVANGFELYLCLFSVSA